MDILLIPIFIPIAAGILILLLPRRLKITAQIITLVVAAVTFAATITIWTSTGLFYQADIFQIGNFGLSFDLVAGRLSSFILVFSSLFGFLIALYSLKSVVRDERLHTYLACLLFSIGGSSGVLLSNHLLFLLIFWEIVTVALYFLVGIGKGEAVKAATRTFALLGVSECAMLLGMGILWSLAGTFNMSSIKIIVNNPLSTAAFILIMTGAITKAGTMPLHTWIPEASLTAPTPIMALLPAAVDKLLGIYLLVRVTMDLFVLNQSMGMLLMIIGAVTIIAAVMMAMVQHDLKKLLSYHAISQVGYMVLGIGTLNPIGIAGGIFHMLNHAIYKSCLFLCAGSVEKRAKTTDLEKLGGLAKEMPITFVCCFIAAMAISGVPPLNGFVSKWMIYQGTVKLGGNASFIFLIAAMFGSALTLASFIKVIHSVFLGQRPKELDRIKEVNWPMWLPQAVLAGLCVGFGIFYFLPVEKLIKPGLSEPVHYTGLWQADMATLMLILGLVVGLLVYLLGNIRRLCRTSRIFAGGETLDSETTRVPGTHFYETIKDIKSLGNIYRCQEKGHLDPYILGIRIVRTIIGPLRLLHSGYLLNYLSWLVFGLLILLFLFCRIW